ncbi:MAG TPA: nucleoside triphosphate pyrophosphohydrolase [Candidatus Baltobacteraceae bacterium]|nr:nucleoside triphosphate pyrophosphohydrolase [Candidatus Baltobacteraceae bacterium]
MKASATAGAFIFHSESALTMLVRIVGLGPGDPQLLTLGSVDALRRIGRAVTLLAPPDLTRYLSEQGIVIVRDLVDDPPLLVRGSTDVIEKFADAVLQSAQDDAGALGLGVLGNPLSDFPGLPPLLRALERRRVRTEIIPGMPRATLSAAITMPLVPLPPASAHHSWDDLIEIMARLRSSCPWDREQTHRTLVPYLIEETYEVVEAIEQNDEAALCEELGDLLLQVVFHAQLGSEAGKFTVADVVDALSNKMVRRHPHVFGDAVIEDVDAQWKNWEKLKALEATGQKRKSRLDGIPKHLGALQRGQRMQEKASRVGFDWPGARDILDKLHEEMTELADAQREKQDDPHVREELGDVFFTLVNLSRAMGIDAETAMREANEKFYKRFSFMEERATKDGKSLSDMTIDELEELWQLAKTEAA